MLCVSSLHTKDFAFQKCKPLLGSLGPVSRARVFELWTDDPERTPTPLQRVQQRGPGCCREILEALFENTEIENDAAVFCVDLAPSRYNEWGRAVLDMQIEKLKSDSGSGREWYLVAYGHSADLDVDPLKKHVHGVLTQVRGVVGLQRRSWASKTARGIFLGCLLPSKNVWAHVRRPAYYSLSVRCIEFRVLAKATTTSNESVTLYITGGDNQSEKNLFLGNSSADPIVMSAGELCGFNVGSFKERSLGAAKAQMPSSLPFLLEADWQYLVHISDGEGKVLRCFADLAWHLTSRHGVTELDMTDHSVAQCTKADGSLQPFRYELSPSSRINSFEPKALEDPATGRASQIGAVMMSSFQDYGIYTGKMFRLAWVVDTELLCVHSCGAFFAMPLADVDALSDDDADEAAGPPSKKVEQAKMMVKAEAKAKGKSKAKAKGKSKAKAKGKSKAKAKGKSKAKAKGKSKAKAKAKVKGTKTKEEPLAEEEAEDEAEDDDPMDPGEEFEEEGVEWPEVPEKAAIAKPIRANRYWYVKEQKIGIKVNGKESSGTIVRASGSRLS
ncbi:unnamed protein product [Symbiodinium microadriaticum]|nr:unnamed protein product [Symbiodinium sp. KB8]CAE7410961.1 unnamed protein product [Symbiodinium microadriaticum]